MRCKRSHRSALTLVEALGGLAILAAVLSGLLVARVRLMRQWKLAEQRSQAARAADAMLAAWWRQPAGLPPAGEGAVPGQSQWRWSTQRRSEPALGLQKLSLIRLEIRSNEQSEAPLVAVEVVQADAHRK